MTKKSRSLPVSISTNRNHGMKSHRQLNDITSENSSTSKIRKKLRSFTSFSSFPLFLLLPRSISSSLYHPFFTSSSSCSPSRTSTRSTPRSITRMVVPRGLGLRGGGDSPSPNANPPPTRGNVSDANTTRLTSIGLTPTPHTPRRQRIVDMMGGAVVRDLPHLLSELKLLLQALGPSKTS